MGHIRSPAEFHGFVGYVGLDTAYRNRTDAIVERTFPFAETILRTDTAANFRQGICLVGQLGGLEQLALLDKIQPVGYVIVNRTLPLTIRVATSDAPAGLRRGTGTVVTLVYFAEVPDALLSILLFRTLARYLEKLQWMLRHSYAACRSDAINEPSSAALGLTTQNFCMKDL